MGREKRHAPGAGAGDHAKERHKRDRKGNLIDWTAPLPPGLVARPEKPRISSKHKSWFELVENKDRKEKKLEYESASGLSKRLSSHLNRVGYHFRQTIVEQARTTLGQDQLELITAAPGLPEPIPEKQEDINKQADAAIRDLFPRIPNTDRQAIIEHAFNKSKQVGKDPPVGLAADVTLSRRVALAVLAHIRHNHTRYDQLLKETSYVNARKAVESLCLDILVKWRGDEETGRDQLDEILREVIVISDSESDESDEDDDEDESEDEDGSSVVSSIDESPVDRVTRDDGSARTTLPPVESLRVSTTINKAHSGGLRPNHTSHKIKKVSQMDKRAAKWAHRGFQRYRAARDQAWNQALERQRREDHGPMLSNGLNHVESPAGYAPQAWHNAPNSVESAHRSYHNHGAPLPTVRMVPEQEYWASGTQRATPVATYNMPQQVHPQEQHQRSDRIGPIVGSQATSYGTPEVERVSYHGQDLKDYLVQSIEPASPQAANLPPRVPASYRPHESGPSYRNHSPVRRAVHFPTAGTGVVRAAQDADSGFAEEGFIRLPPRSEPSRVRVAPEQPDEPFILLNPQNVSAARGSALTATTSGPSLPHPQVWRNTGSARDQPDPRSGTQPVWVGHDGAVLRSGYRPIVIPDHHPSPPRQPQMAPEYITLDNRRPSPTTWHDARYIRRDWTDERDRRYVDQRIETGQDDVKIVRVSNKFPRQHEPRPATPEAMRYHGQPTTQQQGIPRQISSVAIARYDARQPPGPSQFVERVVRRVEVPPSRDEKASFTHQPQGFPRQERVVGIEHIPPYSR
ncbi:hypothetical protein P885DRAFT_69994 [Corynascus similis CBS 632.67]